VGLVPARMTSSTGANPPVRKDWFGQPRGLTVLFLTETWDTFSFYGMRALLVLYMTKHLMMSQQGASWVYGGYAAMIYLTPVFGGVIADRWLGRRAAVLLGGSIMAAGHFMMAFESMLLPALATIAIGNGLFLPSLPSQIDSLYERDDPRRKSAYNVYYFGVNLGALAAPVVIGTIGELFGFHWGFAIAGLGMIVGMAIYVAGSRYLPPDNRKTMLATSGSNAKSNSAVEPPLDRSVIVRRYALLLTIAAVIVVFRGAYEQLGNTIALWADGSVDRAVGATLKIPVTWFQSLNPLMVLLLTPLFVAWWTSQARSGREPSSAAKMTAGAGIVGLSYLMVAGVSAWAQQRGVLMAWPWLVLFMTIMTAGELFILPIGLGLFGRLAPEGLGATTIAVWFSAGVLGNLLAGWIGTLWTPLGPVNFFAVVGGVALVSALGLAVLIPRVGRMEQAA
jgi:proton-dependent oligopeptide transporter, POT family